MKSDYALTVLDTSLAAVNFKDVKAGWTAGAGLEFALMGNWSTKLEYLYMDLGENEIVFSTGAVTGTLQRQFTDHIVRVGVNYRFGAASF